MVFNAEFLAGICDIALRLKRQSTLTLAVNGSADGRCDLKFQAVNIDHKFTGVVVSTLTDILGRLVHLGILLFEEIIHSSHAVECEFADGYLLDSAVGEV